MNVADDGLELLVGGLVIVIIGLLAYIFRLKNAMSAQAVAVDRATVMPQPARAAEREDEGDMIAAAAIAVHHYRAQS